MKKLLVIVSLVFAGIAAEAESLREPNWYTKEQIERMTKVELRDRLLKMQNAAKAAHEVIKKAEGLSESVKTARAATDAAKEANDRKYQSALKVIESDKVLISALKTYLFSVAKMYKMPVEKFPPVLRAEYTEYIATH